MTTLPALGRRRFIGIAAAAAGLGLVPLARAKAAASADLYRWDGSALGARATILLHHADGAAAERLLARCVAEIERLERIFTLYRPDSALMRLNRGGRLDTPPLDLVRLLEEAGRFARLTDGAFDPTVQPLFRLYAEHFGRPGADPAGPPAAAVAAVRGLVGYHGIQIAPERILLERPGMGVTLNGIAQGYITDRIADLLAAEGLDRVLLDLGETRALGPQPDGAPWPVGLRDPRSGGTTATLALDRGAVATSAGSGTVFEPSGRFHHLFDPATGESAHRWLSVTVTAADATTADALSTAFNTMGTEAIRRVLAALPGTTARVVSPDGVRLLEAG